MPEPAGSAVMASPAVVEAISPQQVRFFHTFGFVHLPGLFADDFARLERGFEEAYASEDPTMLDPRNPYHESRDPAYADRVRGTVPYFLERSEDLVWLKRDRRMKQVARRLLGRGFQYAESDGNHFNCDVYWHIDSFGAAMDQLHIKMYFYLDSLRGDSGALRVIPGTNHYQGTYAQGLYGALAANPTACEETFGVALEDVPAWTIDVEPGDLVVGDYRTLHGSFHGAPGRRLFTVNWRQAAPA